MIFKTLSQEDLAPDKIYLSLLRHLLDRYDTNFPQFNMHKTLNTQLFLFPFYDSLEGLCDIFKVIIPENSKKMVYKTESSGAEFLSLNCFASLQISLTKCRSSKS